MNKRAKKPLPKCMDCDKPYPFGIDTVLSDEDWLKINPRGYGLLCANCIVQRASKIDGVITLQATLKWDYMYTNSGGPLIHDNIVRGSGTGISLLKG